MALAVAAFKIEIPALQYLSYGSSAYAIVITITGFPHFIELAKAAKRRIIESQPMKKFAVQSLERDFLMMFAFVPSYRLAAGF